MKLFLVHCGFYDSQTGFGIYESHTNFLVVAESAADARQKAKSKSIFQNSHMHVDGIIEVRAVDGYQIELSPATVTGDDLVVLKHRDLAPSANPPSNP